MFYNEAPAALFSGTMIFMGPWVLLKAFDSEAEARVVESYLSAHSIPVQLLGTFSRYTVMIPGGKKSSGMQLLVPEGERERAKELLHEQERAAHLSVVTDAPPPPVAWRLDKILLTLFALLAAIVLILRYVLPI
jgi:hypothetical protein